MIGMEIRRAVLAITLAGSLVACSSVETQRITAGTSVSGSTETTTKTTTETTTVATTEATNAGAPDDTAKLPPIVASTTRPSTTVEGTTAPSAGPIAELCDTLPTLDELKQITGAAFHPPTSIDDNECEFLGLSDDTDSITFDKYTDPVLIEAMWASFGESGAPLSDPDLPGAVDSRIGGMVVYKTDAALYMCQALVTGHDMQSPDLPATLLKAWIAKGG